MIGIISDTHENEPAIKKAVKILMKHKLDFVVHCGDIISPPMLEHFKDLKIKFVLGNNDGEISGLNLFAKQLGFEPIKEEMSFEYQGKKFYVYHGTNKTWLDAKISEGIYDYILTGHTHIKRDEQIGRTRVINPGALFRCRPYTIALLNAKTNKLEFMEIK